MTEQTNTTHATTALPDQRVVDIDSKLAALSTRTTTLQGSLGARAGQAAQLLGFVSDLVASSKTIAQMATTRTHIQTIGSVFSVESAVGEAKRRAELLAQLVSPSLEELAEDEAKQAVVTETSEWAAELGVLCDATYNWLVAVVEETCEEPE